MDDIQQFHKEEHEHIPFNDKEEHVVPLKGRVYHLYPARFGILAIYGCIGLVNNAIWVANTPITTQSSETYGVSVGVINLLAATYLATTILLIPLGSWMCDVKGPRTVVVSCAILNTVGAWVKYVSGESFWILLGGQMLCAMAQPLFLPVPPKIAANWYGDNERTLATGIGSLSVVAGIAVGYGLSIFLVQEPPNNCCTNLNLTLAIMVTVPSILGILLFRDFPPSPPSSSAGAERDDFLSSIRGVVRQGPFIVLLCTISPGYGIVTAVFSLVGDLAAGQGYTDELSGLVGVVLVVSGLLGAIVFGAILDETKMFKQLIKLGFFGAGISTTLFVLSMQFRMSNWVVLFFSGFAGFFLLALLPMCIELGVEVTYPATEGVVTGALLLFGNLYGLIFFAVLELLIKHDESDGLDSSVSLWVLMGLCLVCCSGGFFIYGDYKRMEYEQRKKDDAEFDQTPNSIQNQYDDSLSISFHSSNPDMDKIRLSSDLHQK